MQRMHNCRIDQSLHDRGLYKTHPRHRIIELFHDNRPWSAVQLEERLHDVARSTIFRTLRLLMKEKTIERLEKHGDGVYFERTDQPHHDHFACDNCNLVECVPCPIPNLTKKHLLEISGRCRMCNS